MLHGNKIKYSLNILTENIIKYMRYLQFVLVSNHSSVSLPTENWVEKKKKKKSAGTFFLSDVAINWIIKVARLDFFGLIPPKFENANFIFLLNVHVYMKLENNASE